MNYHNYHNYHNIKDNFHQEAFLDFSSLRTMTLYGSLAIWAYITVPCFYLYCFSVCFQHCSHLKQTSECHISSQNSAIASILTQVSNKGLILALKFFYDLVSFFMSSPLFILHVILTFLYCGGGLLCFRFHTDFFFVLEHSLVTIPCSSNLC